MSELDCAGCLTGVKTHLEVNAPPVSYKWSGKNGESDHQEFKRCKDITRLCTLCTELSGFTKPETQASIKLKHSPIEGTQVWLHTCQRLCSQARAHQAREYAKSCAVPSGGMSAPTLFQ